ncbi:Cation/H(+) antiporter 15 [Linum grandiflorum]
MAADNKATLEQALNITWVCQSMIHSRSRGLFFGDNPFHFPAPVLMAQLIVSASLSLIIQAILTPLGESAFISMMLAGFTLGPSVWGHNSKFITTLYPLKSFYINETFAFLGCLLFMFVVGAKMDMSMVRRAGKKAEVIGFLTFLVPLSLNLVVANFLANPTADIDPVNPNLIYYMAVLQSVSSFHVITCLLADLKLLNSELGQLAVSSSMISGTCSWVVVIVIFTARQAGFVSKSAMLWTYFSTLFLFLMVIFVMKPIMYLMVRNTPEGKPMKESYILIIFIMLLVMALAGEVCGQHFLIGPVVLGLAVPDGPPLGTAVVNRLESFVSWILLPSYFVYSVAGVNVFTVHSKIVSVVIALGITSFVGKLLAVVLPSLFFKIPPLDALSLGLIMSSQGITDVMLLQQARLLFLLDDQTYSFMVAAIVLVTGILTPVIKLLYQPSKRQTSSWRRSIQNTTLNMELRLLVCIYDPDSTPSLISILEISKPSTKCPVCCYVIHLMEMEGRLSPLLVHHRHGRISSQARSSSHIINAFRSYEDITSSVSFTFYTAVSPFNTIHEEVHRLAMAKRTSMLILPFHRQWKVHGFEDDPKARSVNRHILHKSPCSVGVFVDRGTLEKCLIEMAATDSSTSSKTKTEVMCSIGMIFIQGRDDREALAYAMRMGEKANVGVTLVHIIETDYQPSTVNSVVDLQLDCQIISDFKIATVSKKHHVYKEENVKDSVEMVSVVRRFENVFHIIIVGRHHDRESIIYRGLMDWNYEFPELGFLGDMLVASDCQCRVSVLVVQQQRLEWVGGEVAEMGSVSDDAMSTITGSNNVSKPWKHGQVWPAKM